MPTIAGLIPLLKREYWGLRANTLLLLVVILLPVSLGLMFGTLKNITPKSAPSGLFPEPGAGDEDVRVANGIVSFFSKTTIEQAMDEKKLFREEFYLYVGVPPNFGKGAKEINVYIDSSMSPVSELSPYVKDMILYGLSKWYGWEPKINIVTIGKAVLPFQYLVPGIVIVLSAAVGLIIIPFSLSQDREVLSRVLSSVSVFSFVVSKLLFAAFLAALQLAILLTTQRFAGVSGALIEVNIWSALVLLMSAAFFTSIGMAVMFFTRFSETGKQINAGLMAFVVIFSGAVYPVGFFPLLPGFGDILQSIGRANPAYHFVVLMRGFGVRGLGPEIFNDYLAFAMAFTLLSILILAYLVYRRKTNG